MTNTRRNTIVLSALLALLLGGSISMFRNINNKAQTLIRENASKQKKIDLLDAQIRNIDSLKWEYEMRKAMVAEQSKVIVQEDTPTITYKYLLKMLTWMKRNVLFDFALSDKGKKETTWNEYIVSGRSNYRDVLEFTRNLEHQRSVLTIEELSIGSDGVAHSDTVSFSLVFRTHFGQGGLDMDEIKPKKLPPITSFYQLFKSRVYLNPVDEDNIDPTLIRVDKCSLIGIAENRIFLRDSQGIIRILTVGAKVANGKLDGIDPAKGKATFIINKFGIPEEFSLFLTIKK